MAQGLTAHLPQLASHLWGGRLGEWGVGAWTYAEAILAQVASANMSQVRAWLGVVVLGVMVLVVKVLGVRWFGTMVLMWGLLAEAAVERAAARDTARRAEAEKSAAEGGGGDRHSSSRSHSRRGSNGSGHGSAAGRKAAEDGAGRPAQPQPAIAGNLRPAHVACASALPRGVRRARLRPFRRPISTSPRTRGRPPPARRRRSMHPSSLAPKQRKREIISEWMESLFKDREKHQKQKT